MKLQFFFLHRNASLLSLLLLVILLVRAPLVHSNWGHNNNHHMHCNQIGAENNALREFNINFTRAYQAPPNPDYSCLTFDDDKGGGPNSCPALLDTIDPGDPDGVDIVYNQLNGNSPRTYNATTVVRVGIVPYETVTTSCAAQLSCQDSCTPPQDIGNCSNQCDIQPQAIGGCPQGVLPGSYDLIPATSNFTVDWGDTFQSNGSGTIQHSYANAGVYDIQLSSGGGTCCIRRVNVICSGNGSLPTATPTPTGGPSQCAEGFQCMNPCACSQQSPAYQNGCNDGATGVSKEGKTLAQGKEGAVLGAQLLAQGTVEGGSCGIGLVCCTVPPQIGTDPWYKVKNASFHKLGNLIDAVPDPDNAEAFDNEDDGLCDQSDPSSITCMDINEPGVVTADGYIDTANAPISFRGWSGTNYNFNNNIDPDAFLAYVLARKNYVQITDFNEMQSDIINYIQGDFTVDNNGFQGKTDFVLVVDGNLTIDQSNTFNPSNKSMAFVVTGTLNIRSNVSAMNGIYIGNDVDFASDIPAGSTTTNQLKVNGNLVSFTEGQCTDKRQRTDNDKPSCFFVHNIADHFLPLIDMLSIRTYAWEELTP